MRTLLVLGLSLAACEGEKGGSTPDDSPADSRTEDTAPESPYGIDERPANPTCTAPARPISDASVALERGYASLDLTHPVGLVTAPGVTSRWWVLEKEGHLLTFPAVAAGEDGSVASTEALDLSDKVALANEAGLLGMAFHPNFAENGYAYLHYTRPGGSGVFVSRVARFSSEDGGLSFDPDTEKVIFEVDQPYENHNGGHLAFGPDGYLYVGYGDGGSSGDPLGNGQNTDVALGKMLRLDVDGGDPYAIPADNPFAEGGGLAEIYAWGLRNPWKYSFDTETGELWVGDVGQDSWEEVDLLELGGNYGWDTREGAHCFRTDTCEDDGMIDPIVEYSHEGEDRSITGGVVYRGTAIPGLVGVYLYADLYAGPLYGVSFDNTTGEPTAVTLLDSTGIKPVAFAEDSDGEVMLLDYGGGALYRLVPNEAEEDTATEDPFPQLLSETGCVDPADPTQPASGLIPFGVNSPLWSDGADKERYFAIPDGGTIEVDAEGDWELPIGSVVMKTFLLEDRPVETRLLVRHEDGGWAGYSYVWDEAGTDATLLLAGSERSWGDSTWIYPSRAGCLQCHTGVKGYTLGLETGQINGAFTYTSGRTRNQIDTLNHLGLFSETLAPSEVLPALPAPDDATASDAERARSYLYGNCAQCHQPGGTGLGEADLRYDTPLSETGICDAVPQNGDLGVTDARVLAPGDPDRSVLSLRLHAVDFSRMPPLGTDVVDTAGVALVDDWILGLVDCAD